MLNRGTANQREGKMRKKKKGGIFGTPPNPAPDWEEAFYRNKCLYQKREREEVEIKGQGGEAHEPVKDHECLSERCMGGGVCRMRLKTKQTSLTGLL